MRTVFFDVLDAADKGSQLRAQIHGREGSTRTYALDVHLFAGIPGAQFSYSIPASLLAMATARHVLSHRGFQARQGFGASTRFHRLRWEVPAHAIGFRKTWADMAHGTKPALAYKPTVHVVRWRESGAEAKADICHRYPYLNGNYGFKIQNEGLYGAPGLAYGKRTNRFTCQVMPAGHVFSFEGTAIHANGQSFDPRATLATLALLNTKVVAFWLNRTCAQHKAYNYVNDVPWPQSGASIQMLEKAAKRAFVLQRSLDTRTESSHAFYLPALLQANGETLAARSRLWNERAGATQAELDALAAEIDDQAYRLYGISEEDRQRIEQGFGTASHTEASPEDDDGDESDDDGDVAEVDATPMVASLLSWKLGVAFGRFDVRLAIGEREAPPEPEPFDPLPVCSPGMLTGDGGLPVVEPPAGYLLTFPTDGILVDDPGHSRDVVRAVRSVFEAVFDDANARWHEAAELLGAPDLRTWFARGFFEPHIKRYSKSRRKAPIYWQLATASGSYSVWIYIHRATGDTLFRVLNDFVGPKLDHEKSKLDGLNQETGANPSAAQRREIEQQETFVGELQALKAEVARVAPLWKPNLDDGVILNFAPLWRLVPQSRSWQGECKKAWDKLVAGDYDWAHLAMHLWPERVVPKCIDDRSLAIAHGLDDVFWHEDDSGTWRKSRVDDVTVQKLIQERTSTTVKAALKDLLSAAAPTASKGRKAKGRSVSPRTSTPKPAPAAARATTPDTVLDEATLRAVKAAIASVADGASKADVLAATGLSDSVWNQAIATLLDRGDVTRTGQQRGTRYHSQGESDA